MDESPFPGRLKASAAKRFRGVGNVQITRVNVSEDRERIAAVVVTHNRRLLLQECLDSLLAQSRLPEAIVIVDNHSTDGTHDHLLTRELIHPDADAHWTVRSVPASKQTGRQIDVHYVRLKENSGGAGGFHEGMKRALEAGFDWMWLMDDDVLACPDALAVLVHQKDRLQAAGDKPVLLNSLVLARGQGDPDQLAFPLQEIAANGDPKRGVCYWRLSQARHLVKDGLYRWACPFNGTFVSARIVREIGLPNRDFFIWGDERDFLWRAARRFDLYTAVDSRIYHPLSREMGFDWRQYYNIRNAFVVNRHFRYRRLRNLKLILGSLVRGLAHGPRGLGLVLRAIHDGLAGRLGKRDDLTS